VTPKEEWMGMNSVVQSAAKVGKSNETDLFSTALPACVHFASFVCPSESFRPAL
jgi:hypothetical protein